MAPSFHLSAATTTSTKHSSPTRTASTCSSVSHSGNITPESASPALSHCVKNTFVEIPVGRGLSLDEWFHEREVGSCPASGLRAPPGLEFPRMPSVDDCELLDDVALVSIPPPPWPRSMSGEGFEEMLNGTVQALSSPVPPFMWPRTMSGDTLELMFPAASFAPWNHPAPLACDAMPPPPSMIARTVDACSSSIPPPPAEPAPVFQSNFGQREELELFGLLEQEVGTADVPTLGSVGHRYGTCKPCAFLHTRGCTNGKSCNFCHLCDSGEKKRRQKEKKEAFRAQRMLTSQ